MRSALRSLAVLAAAILWGIAEFIALQRARRQHR